MQLDCGAHPKAQGQDCLPFFDCSPDMDLATIDLCLITYVTVYNKKSCLDVITLYSIFTPETMLLYRHFHVDHIASLPYLTEHTNFKVEH